MNYMRCFSKLLIGTLLFSILSFLPFGKLVSAQACSLKQYGDANCDNTIDLLDFEIFREEYVAFKAGTLEIENTKSDFNSDLSIDLLDLEVFREGYITKPTVTPTISLTPTTTPTSSTTPTPSITTTPTPTLTTTPTPVISGKTYYVDCANGNDTNTGLSQTSAWKTLTKVNSTSLLPGEGILFKSGCTFNGQFTARWSGNAKAPITISSYGTGNKPTFTLDAKNTSLNSKNILVSGDYLVIDSIRVTLTNAHRDTSCTQDDGTAVRLGWYIGMYVTGSNTIIRNSEADNLAIGIYIGDGTTKNKIQNNYIHDLNVLWRIDTQSGAMGALGILIHGDDHDIGYNLLEKNLARCTLSNGAIQGYSAPFEIYDANRNIIHHNKTFGHRKHLELGKGAGKTADDNVIAYNLFVSSYPSAVGPNIHGAGNQFGPVNRTKVLNNTIVFSGASSQGISCSCSGGATVKNNIFIGTTKAAYFSGSVVEDHNIFWKIGGSPFVQFASGTMSQTSKKIDPSFINLSVPDGDFHLKNGSPAINSGTTTEFTTDLDKNSVPKGSTSDIGAYEAN